MTVSDDLRLYLVQTAEKGIGWLRLTAHGPRRARLDAQRRERRHRPVRRRSRGSAGSTSRCT